MNKKLIGIIAACVIVVLVPVAGLVGVVVFSTMQVLNGNPAALNCTVGGGGRGDTDAAVDTGTAASSGPQPTAAVQVDGGDGKNVTLTNAQQRNAATIIAIGESVNVPSRGVQVALMVALQESNLRNLSNPTVPGSAQHANDGSGSDHDSVGVFQQRANWGSVDERMEPTYQAKAFFGGPRGPNHGTPRGLLDIPNWQSLGLAEAAQAVQVSKFPSAYAKWEAEASAIMTNQGITVTADTSVPTSSNGGGCPVGGSGSSGGSDSGGDTENASWSAPNGKTGADMVAYAEQYVGKVPYSGACGSAGSPTAGWCCTGFVYYMYHQVLGVDLPSPVVSGQLAQAHQIPESEVQAGDLVAWVGHHIGIADGKGGLIHSPDWGRKLTHAKSYQFTIGGTGPTFWRVNALGDGKW